MVEGHWQEIVAIKVDQSHKVEVHLSSQGVILLLMMMEGLHPQKTGVLLLMDYQTGFCVNAVPPMGFGTQIHRSRIRLASSGLQHWNKKTGNPTGSMSPWLGITGFFLVYVAEFTDGFEDLLL